MVYILPQNDEHPRLTYNYVYDDILRSRRTSPDSSVVLLVPPQPDALCAAKILSTLFQREDIRLNIIPVAGYPSLNEEKRTLLDAVDRLHHIILLNIGSVLDIGKPEWFGDFPSSVTIHIIDSARPFELANLFGGAGPSNLGDDDGSMGPRVVVWDDGHARTLVKERAAFEAGEYGYNSDSDSDDDEDDQDDEESSEPDYDDEGEDGSRKRRRSGSNDGRPGRRRRRKSEEAENGALSREQRQINRNVLTKHYTSGTHHGQSAAGVAYTLCTLRGCADIDLLWLAILGLTHQYLSLSISLTQYEHYYGVLNDEVARLGRPTDNAAAKGRGDDSGIRPSTEFRFPLMQKWNLYDAMTHSSYVANKFQLWKERGPQKLNRLLTKMGLSLQQSQQEYIYMNSELRDTLSAQIDAFGPECGLLEPSYTSFTKSYGNEMSRTSAADILAGTTALLEAAKGVKLMVELQGGKGGGELFGSERIWELRKGGKENIPLLKHQKEKGQAGGDRALKSMNGVLEDDDEDKQDEDDELEMDGEKVWRQNFWTAFDGLGTNPSLLRKSIPLAISLQRAIVRQGSSILEKNAIKYFTAFRFTKITEGPDLAIFAHPNTLTRLTQWLVEALRDRIPTEYKQRLDRAGKKGYPFVVACLNERTNSYLVVGVTSARDMHDIRKNEFGLAFLKAKDVSNARARHGTFETSVIEVNAQDFGAFMDVLSST